jgi:hypothetical protein
MIACVAAASGDPARKRCLKSLFKNTPTLVDCVALKTRKIQMRIKVKQNCDNQPDKSNLENCESHGDFTQAGKRSSKGTLILCHQGKVGHHAKSVANIIQNQKNQTHFINVTVQLLDE